MLTHHGAYSAHGSSQQPSGKLSQEKSTNQHRVGDELKADIGIDTKCDHHWNRDVNGQEPVGGECFCIGSPVAEGEINKEYDQGNNPEVHTSSILVRHLKNSGTMRIM